MHAGRLDKGASSKSPFSVYMNTISTTMKKRNSQGKFRTSHISSSVTRPYQIQGLGTKRDSIDSDRQHVRVPKSDESDLDDDIIKMKTAALDEELQELKMSRSTVEKSLQLAHEQNEELKHKAEELAQQLDEFKAENEHLKESSTTVQDDVEDTMNLVKQLEVENDQLKGKIQRREEHIKKLRSHKAEKSERQSEKTSEKISGKQSGKPSENGSEKQGKPKPTLAPIKQTLRRKPDRSNKSKACVIS